MIEVLSPSLLGTMNRAAQDVLLPAASAGAPIPAADKDLPEGAGASSAVGPAPAAAPATAAKPKKKKKQGLGYWMRRVLKEDRRAAKSFDPDVVHDLRVALRRCRSIARAMRDTDGGPGWRPVKKTGQKAFRRLGKLRDVQVMKEWLVKLAPENDPVRQALLDSLSQREQKLVAKSLKAVGKFNRKKWKKLIPGLEVRAQRLELDGPQAQQLALSRLAMAHRAHWHAVRSGAPADWHAVRIGLKRFRYVVENFLPVRHALWGDDLKRLQDLLGEVHDLDVLWERLPQAGPVFDARERARWRSVIRREQAVRLAEYRAMMTGKDSRWKAWRASLAAQTAERQGALDASRPAPVTVSESRSRRAAHAAA